MRRAYKSNLSRNNEEGAREDVRQDWIKWHPDGRNCNSRGSFAVEDESAVKFVTPRRILKPIGVGSVAFYTHGRKETREPDEFKFTYESITSRIKVPKQLLVQAKRRLDDQPMKDSLMKPGTIYLHYTLSFSLITKSC
jgi:hypothetical protein